VNVVGILLVGLGALLMVAEAYTPGFGIFGGAGVFCIVLGSIILLPIQTGRWLISTESYAFLLTLIAAIASILGTFTLFMIYKIVQARRRRPVVGGLIGEAVEVVDEITPEKPGSVKYHGEYWRARSDTMLKAGTIGLVDGKDGPTLIVKPKPR